MKYYPSKTDQIWNEENRNSIGYCHGFGVDVGAKDRTLHPHMITVDKNPFTDVDYHASADNLPFDDAKFDFVYCSHTLEHCTDVLKVLKEFIRVVKKEGYIIIIMPDSRFIPSKGTIWGDVTHTQDWTWEEFYQIVKILNNVEIVNKNIWALRDYSFLFVLRRIK